MYWLLSRWKSWMCWVHASRLSTMYEMQRFSNDVNVTSAVCQTNGFPSYCWIWLFANLNSKEVASLLFLNDSMLLASNNSLNSFPTNLKQPCTIPYHRWRRNFDLQGQKELPCVGLDQLFVNCFSGLFPKRCPHFRTFEFGFLTRLQLLVVQYVSTTETSSRKCKTTSLEM